MAGRRSNAEIAIILGAGASIPPLVSQQDLVETLLGACEDRRIRPAQIYLRRTFKGLSQPGSPKGILRFEEVVGPLEIAESEEYWFHFGGKTEDDQDRILTNRQVLDSLDTWVAMSLDPPSLPKPANSIRRNAEEISRFADFYQPRIDSPLCYSRLVSFLDQQGLLGKAVFVSMNYDILLDRVLNVSPGFFPDYDLEDFVKERIPSKEIPGKTSVKLLKLHGSLNWRMCESCHLLRDTGNAVVWPQSQCNDCGKKVARPMLIRPTLLKDFRHRVWKDVWRKAGHVLASASHWIFIGYSLPMADVWMLRLLAQSARSGGSESGQRKITVVNPDPDVLQRFKLLFPVSAGREQNFQSWIEEYVAAGKLISA